MRRNRIVSIRRASALPASVNSATQTAPTGTGPHEPGPTGAEPHKSGSGGGWLEEPLGERAVDRARFRPAREMADAGGMVPYPKGNFLPKRPPGSSIGVAISPDACLPVDRVGLSRSTGGSRFIDGAPRSGHRARARLQALPPVERDKTDRPHCLTALDQRQALWVTRGRRLAEPEGRVESAELR
jgi:hypothetical protein